MSPAGKPLGDLCLIQAVFYPFEFLWRSVLRLFRPPEHHSFLDAEYDNGLVVEVIDRTVRHIEWSRKVAKTSRCPLTVYLDSGVEIDESTFQSPEAMRALGAKLSQGPKTTDGQDSSFALFRTDGYFVEAMYVEDAFDFVTVEIRPQAQGTLRVGVDGRTFELPISQDRLFEILGPPAREE